MNYIIIDFEMNPVAGEDKEERQICRCEIIEMEQSSWMKASWCWENSRL